MSDQGKEERAPQLESKTFIQPDRGLIVTEYVQEWSVPTTLDFPAQEIHKPASKALAAPVVIHANRADLNVSVEAHSFSCHRNETTPVANSDVVAHLVGSLTERTGFGLLDQIAHVFRIGVTQGDHFRIVHASGFVASGYHLMDHTHTFCSQSIDWNDRIEGQQCYLLMRQQELAERLVGRRGLARHSCKRSHVGVVATGKQIALAQMRLSGCQGRPDGVIEARWC